MTRPKIPLALVLPGATLPQTTVWNDDEQPDHKLVDEARKARAVADFTRVLDQTKMLDVNGKIIPGY